MSRSENRTVVGVTLGLTGAVVVLAITLAALLACTAQGRVEVIHGKAYGVTPNPRAQTLRSLVGRANPPTGRATPLTVGGAQPPLEYGGGPVMLSSKLYLIFWGPAGSFAESYTAPIIQYAKDLEAAQALSTDEFSVAELYGNAAEEQITGKVTFGGDVFDTTSYPGREPLGGCPEKTPCVTDSQIRTEIRNGSYGATPQRRHLRQTGPLAASRGSDRPRRSPRPPAARPEPRSPSMRVARMTSASRSQSTNGITVTAPRSTQRVAQPQNTPTPPPAPTRYR
jgi:hypothetical protein